MKKCYYLLNGAFILSLFFMFSAQNPKSDKTNIIDVSNPTNIKENIKIKDSLVKATNQTLDEVIQYSTKINLKKDEFLKLKEEEQVVLKNYITTVNEYLKGKGRKEKIVIKYDLKQQLRDGEVFLIKDSTCTDYKRRFLGPKKCVKWEYHWFLVDKANNKEKLW